MCDRHSKKQNRQGNPYTYIKTVESTSEFPSSSWLTKGRVLSGSRLCSIGDARNCMLQLLVDQVPISLVRCHVRVLQTSTGCRVEHGDVPLENPAGCSHLVLVVDILQLLMEIKEKEIIHSNSKTTKLKVFTCGKLCKKL